MKVDKGVSTWRIWGTLATISPHNNCILIPTRTITGHINNQYKVLVNILYLIFNI